MTDNQFGVPTNNEEFDQLILSGFPYLIASSYQKLLEATTWRAKIDEGLKIFEFGLRTAVLVLINQYLNEDIKKVNNERFNQLLLSQLPEATLGSWVELFFRSLQVYEGKESLFFTPELYEIQWDTSQGTHVKRKGVRVPFQRLVELRNARAHLRLADTEENAQEVLHNLQAVLTQFAFIRNYTLIRITEKLDEEQCRYAIYRGLTIEFDNGGLKLWRKGDKQLHQNWFYLLRKTSKGREVLEMHPFLVAWLSEAQKAVDVEKVPNHGVALYDRLLKTKVTYISIPDQILVEHERPLLDQIRSILYFVIEEVRMGQGGKTRFSWQELKAAAQELSTRNMKGVQQKYSSELYLQREETFQQFNDFLTSDKTGFVLTGKSGVGKSNFVLSLADAYADQDKLCYLVYDGARLSVPEKMQDTVSQDLGRRLELVDTMRQDLFTTLKDNGFMTHRKLLVVFDAINENANGKDLLQRIDELVGMGDDYPWLKVLITSRPQAWRTLKRGLHLAQDNYFQPHDVDDLAVEMAEFAIKLEEFKRGELELAYEKYRIVYKLQTSYKALPVSIRETLRDPLMLRLVADIYRDKALPRIVRVSDIYESYVAALIQTNRLEYEDIIFLEREIVPRMLSTDYFDNKLTTAQIAQAKTRDGRPLWEMIRVSERLNGGEAINASYQRLSNAEILIEQGSPTDYEVSFKYERFYDYYGGRRLRELAEHENPEELRSTYERWMLKTQEHPFLWGSVQSALLNELKQGREALIISLCQTDEQLAKEMMVATITEYGQEEDQVRGKLAATAALLERLMALGDNELSLWQRKVIVWQNTSVSQSITNAQKAAVEAAGNLGSADILLLGNLSRSSPIRTYALRQTLFLWQKDKEKGFGSTKNNRGFAVLLQLLGRIRTTLIPNLQAVETGLIMIVYLYLMNYERIEAKQEENLASELRRLARHTLDKILYIGDEKKLGSVSRRMLREWMVRSMSKMFSKTSDEPSETQTFNTENITTFLERPLEEKEFLYVILRCMDPYNTDITELEEQIDQVFVLGEGTVDTVLILALIIQWDNNKSDVLRIASHLFEEGMKQPIPTWATYTIQSVLAAVLAQGKGDEEVERQFLYWMKRGLEEGKGKMILSVRAGQEYYRCDFSGYFDIMYLLHQKIDTVFLEPFVDRAINENNDGLLKVIIHELGTLINEPEYHSAIFRVIGYMLKYENEIIQERIVNLLARLRKLVPEDVDDFMLEARLSSEWHRKVKTVEVKEQVAADFLRRPLNKFITVAVPSNLYEEAIWILEQTIHCTTMQQFLNQALKRVINLAYGEEVFRLST